MQQVPDWVDLGGEAFPPIEDRTLLFALPPIGVGTAECESLSSYVIRLAREHSLPPRRFISRILLGCVDQAKPRCDAKFFRHYAATVNGLGQYAEKFVRALCVATGRNDLEALTMLPWKGLLAPNGTPLTFASRRWCAACLHEFRDSAPLTAQSRPTYWPLSWSISAVSCCSRHLLPLTDACPHCARHQPTLPRTAELDRCDFCRKPLSVFEDSAEVGAPPPALIPLWQASTAAPVANLVGQMIRLGPSVEQENVHKRWVTHIAQHVAATGSDRASTCRQIGLNPRAMYEWFERGAGVSLESVLKVCLHLGISIDAVFGAPDAQVPVKSLPTPHPTSKPARRRHDLATRVQAKAALDDAIADVQPRTLLAISERLDVSTGYLRYWFPKEVAALRAIHHRRLLEARELRQQRDAALIESTIQAMLRAGTYPGRKRIEAALRAAGTSLLSSSNLAVYRMALLLNVKR